VQLPEQQPGSLEARWVAASKNGIQVWHELQPEWPLRQEVGLLPLQLRVAALAWVLGLELSLWRRLPPPGISRQ